jgi:hypothetical protein
VPHDLGEDVGARRAARDEADDVVLGEAGVSEEVSNDRRVRVGEEFFERPLCPEGSGEGFSLAEREGAGAGLRSSVGRLFGGPGGSFARGGRAGAIFFLS